MSLLCYMVGEIRTQAMNGSLKTLSQTMRQYRRKSSSKGSLFPTETLLCVLGIEVEPFATLMANLYLLEWLQGIQSISRNWPVHLDIPLKLFEINPQYLIFLTWFTATQCQPVVWHYEKFFSLLGGSNPILQLFVVDCRETIVIRSKNTRKVLRLSRSRTVW